MSFLMVPKAPITNGTVVVLSPHMRSTSISKYLYLLSFSVVLTEVLVSRGTIISMRRQVLSFLFFSTLCGGYIQFYLVQGKQRPGGQWSRRNGHSVYIMGPRQAS